LAASGSTSASREELKTIHVAAAKRARKHSLSLRAFVSTGVGKWLMTSARERHWDTLIKMMAGKPLSACEALVPAAWACPESETWNDKEKQA
jgi:hypothetical protein